MDQNWLDWLMPLLQSIDLDALREGIMEQDAGAFLFDAFNTVNTIQGLIIGALIAMITPRFPLVFLTAGLALLIDQCVTIANNSFFDKSVEKVFEKAIEEVMSLDATVLILRYVGFVLVIGVVYTVKSLVLRDNK